MVEIRMARMGLDPQTQKEASFDSLNAESEELTNQKPSPLYFNGS
jgi:hypothetical protein